VTRRPPHRPRILRRVADIRALSRRFRARGETVVLVPTMGFLHAGHAALLARARALGHRVVLSIFVNPLQFGPREDFAAYPRDERRDLAIARRMRVDAVYIPAAREMYPPGFSTVVEPGAIANRLCGRTRPGHFAGVCTVVLKLLQQVEPQVLVLGQKDAQQVVILARMCRDLDLDVRVVAAPTVREPDGLAMSSRNIYLRPAERRQAPALYAALRAGVDAARRGERRSTRIADAVRARLGAVSPIRVEYVAVVDLHDLLPHDRLPPQALIAVAARLGRARLIDNVIVHSGESRRRRGRRPVR
jgi:pantoate--beta-alanine ligase